MPRADLLPQFPVYIPSKGRAVVRLTYERLRLWGVPARLVVEPQEHRAYLDAGVPARDLIVLDMAYKEQYETLDDFGLSRGTGPGPARNYIWDHAISEGHARHWVMDDNIRDFYRLHQNTRLRFGDATGIRMMEDFTLRYRNVAMAGPQYYMFAVPSSKIPPFTLNTRIYSCNLIRNDVPFRWRGRYNEDTILILDMLKAGWCTIQFNAVLQNKLRTQLLKGGNSDEFYSTEGTYAKSRMLADTHPDVAKVVWKFSRVHHEVNYRPFKNRALLPAEGAAREVKDYGLRTARRDPARDKLKESGLSWRK